MMNEISDKLHVLEIPPDYAGQRLDQALAALYPVVSRSQIQVWIREGRVRVASAIWRARDKVKGGEQVEIDLPPAPEPLWQAEAIPLHVIYEDAQLLVIDKPAGLVVHPAAGNWEGTLLNALLHYAPELKALARAGIVHRLDKETSGLLVIARTEVARLNLIEQLQARTVEREYLALVNGTLVAGGTIDAPIGRHGQQRTRMAVTSQGKPAISHYRIERRYRAHTLLRVKLESGRTHQIRVHMAHLRHPILGDPVYGGRLQTPRGAHEDTLQVIRNFKRQALHAARLGLLHPSTGETLQWTCAPPADMQALLAVLEADVQHV